MKNNATRIKLPYFLTHRIHGKDSNHGRDLAVPKLKKTEFDLKNILRWEDDGGQLTGSRVPSTAKNAGQARKFFFERASSED